MATRLIPLVLCLFLLPTRSAAHDAPLTTLAGPLDRFTIESEALEQSREIVVALPRDYGDGDQHYPVLYVLDSDWHMLPAVAAVRMLAETSYIGAHRMPPVIVIGIRSIDRNHDLTPTACLSQHGMSFPTSGGAEAFLSFLEEELVPEVERRYRSNPRRILAGWSLGGLFTVHALFERPSIFSGFLAISPSLWWDERLLLQRGLELVTAGDPRPQDLVITVGADEEGGLCYEAIRDLVGHWEADPVSELNWQFLEIEGEDHNHSPYDAYFDGLRALHATWFYPEQAFSEGLSGLELHYAGLSGRWGHEVPIPDHLYAALSRQYLSEGRKDEAIEVSESQCRAHPESALVRYELGEVCRRAGRFERARKAYGDALELELSSSEPDTVFVDWLGARLASLEDQP